MTRICEQNKQNSKTAQISPSRCVTTPFFRKEPSTRPVLSKPWKNDRKDEKAVSADPHTHVREMGNVWKKDEQGENLNPAGGKTTRSKSLLFFDHVVLFTVLSVCLSFCRQTNHLTRTRTRGAPVTRWPPPPRVFFLFASVVLLLSLRWKLSGGSSVGRARCDVRFERFDVHVEILGGIEMSIVPWFARFRFSEIFFRCVLNLCIID